MRLYVTIDTFNGCIDALSTEPMDVCHYYDFEGKLDYDDLENKAMPYNYVDEVEIDFMYYFNGLSDKNSWARLEVTYEKGVNVTEPYDLNPVLQEIIDNELPCSNWGCFMDDLSDFYYTCDEDLLQRAKEISTKPKKEPFNPIAGNRLVSDYTYAVRYLTFLKGLYPEILNKSQVDEEEYTYMVITALDLLTFQMETCISWEETKYFNNLVKDYKNSEQIIEYICKDAPDFYKFIKHVYYGKN